MVEITDSWPAISIVFVLVNASSADMHADHDLQCTLFVFQSVILQLIFLIMVLSIRDANKCNSRNLAG